MAKAAEKKKETTGEVIKDTIKRITNKDILGELEVPKEKTFLYTVLGSIAGYKIGNSIHGEYFTFRGDFMAITADGLKEFRAPSLIIPFPLDVKIASAFDSLHTMSNGKRVICEIAFKVGYEPGETPTGYTWILEEIIKLVPSNSLDALKSRVMSF